MMYEPFLLYRLVGYFESLFHKEVQIEYFEEVICLRIFVVQSVGGFSTDQSTGGGTLHLMRLAEEWSEKGHEVILITNTSDMGSSAYERISHIIRVKSLTLGAGSESIRFIIGALFNYFIQRRALDDEIKTVLGKPCVSAVVSVSPYPSDVLMASYLHSRLNLPTVVHIHHLPSSPLRHPFKRGGLTRVVVNWVVYQSSLFLIKLNQLVPCIMYPQVLEKAGWRFHTPVLRDANSLSEFPHEQSKPSDVMTAALIGRLAPNKGIIDAIRSWRYVVNAMPDAKLVIAGACPNLRFRQKMERCIRRLQLQDKITVTFHHISQKRKKQLLENCKVFLFPSYEEGWSLSVMEAAAYGAIPVVYDLDAYQYLGPNVPRVKIGDVKGLAEAAISIFLSRQFYLSVAKEVRQRVISYSTSEIAEQEVKEIYRMLAIDAVKDRT